MAPPYTSIIMSGRGAIGQSNLDPSLIAEDSFTASNGTKFLDHEPAGGPVWFPTMVTATGSDNSDHGSIQNNKLTILSDNFGAMMHANTSEQHVEVDWTPSADANARNSIILRNGGTYGSGYMMNFRRDNQDVNIFRVTGSTNTTLANTAVTFNAGQTYRIKGIASGTSLELYVDDVLKVSTTDSTYQTNEFVGLSRNTGNSTSTFDNFLVKDASGPKTLFLPSDISGLWCWLEAEDPGSTPGTWEDKSGNGNDWTPGVAPTFNSGEVVFNGSTQYLNGPSMLGLSSATFLGRLKNNSSQSAYGSDTGIAWLGTDGNNDHYPYGGTNYLGWGIASRPAVGTTAGTNIFDWHTLSVISNGAGGAGNYKVRTMRKERHSSQQTVAFRADPRIGRSASNYYYYGSMKDFIIYDKVLSTGELYAVETYLAGL